MINEERLVKLFKDLCLIDAPALREAALGQEHPEVAKSWMFLGELAEARGEPGEARKWFARAVAVAKQHPDDASFLAEAESALARVSSAK